jgi:hypothetical protein
VCDNILIPKENIKVLLDSFVLQNKNNNYIYEIYIDKQDPNNYNLLFYAGEKSLTEKENEAYKQIPVANVVIRGVKIFIYSGVEHYFTSSGQINIIEKKISKENKQITWAIKDSSGIITYYKIDVGYPFIPLPLKNEPDTFVPPIVTPD